MSKKNNNFYRFQDQRVYIGAGNLDQRLTPGCYQMKLCRQSGEVYIEQMQSAKIDKTSYTPQMNEILGITNCFAKNVISGKFQKHSYKSKFGLLLEGPPGTGKSQTVNVATDGFIEAGGIVVFVSDENVYRGCAAGMYLKKLNAIEPNMPIMLVLEDLDSLQPYNEVFVTSILDGEQSPQNTFFLGTTNFLQRISERMKRPGRFDLIYKVDGLSDEMRKAYILDKVKEFELQYSKADLDKIFSLTNGYNFSEIRTYMSYVGFFGFNYEHLAGKITRLSSQKTPDEKPDSDELVGEDDDFNYDEEN